MSVLYSYLVIASMAQNSTKQITKKKKKDNLSTKNILRMKLRQKQNQNAHPVENYQQVFSDFNQNGEYISRTTRSLQREMWKRREEKKSLQIIFFDCIPS